MSQPPVPYDRLFNFETFSTTNPTVQQPGVQIDGELDALKITVDSVISRLSEIQRSDGKLNPQAFESTGIPEAIATQAYSQTYAQLQPLVLAASQSAVTASISASTAGNHANSADASATAANAAIAPAVAAKDLAVTKAAEAQNWAVQANASASTAASAEVETQSHKQSTLDARDEAQQALSSITILKASLDSQYDNMLDADQNLADVSSKGQSVTNLGLNSSDTSDRSIYNRFKSMFHMYVDPNADQMVGYQSYLTSDAYLQGMFGLTFNESTGLFVRSSTGGTWFGEEVISGNGAAEDVAQGNKTLAQRVEVLKIRMSVISSILRTTMYRISKRYGYNGDNRLVTLQDFSDNPVDNLGYRIWAMLQGRLATELNYQFEIREAPTDFKLYARMNGGWQEISQSGSGISEYDNFKVYTTNDVVWLGSFIYRFNSSIGAAGYGPVTHPYAWTKLSASAVADITGLQTALDAKAPSSHTHTIANVTDLQTNLNAKASTTALTTGLAGKANSSHTQAISTITGLQTALDGKSSTSHTHDISGITGWSAQLLPYEKRTLPMLNGNYWQELTVTNPGYLYILDYASDSQGKVNFGNPYYNYGERYYFYQSASATYPIQFVNAINIDGKTFTRGAKSRVEAVCTPDGWVVSGDLMFPPSGTPLSSSCDYVENLTDASGSSNWSGNFYSNNVYADGNGGTYSSGGYNQNGCWYPMGFCIQYNVNIYESSVNWSGCSQTGNTVYSYSFGNVYSDGNGSSYTSTTGGWSAQYGDVIYDSGSCIVKHDGMGGYYVEDNSNTNPSYGSYLGNFSFPVYVVFWTGENFEAGTGYEDRYADGNGGVAWTSGTGINWYGYGTNIGYSYTDVYVYSDGNGGYYT
jgi:hypothetical protein